MSYFSRFTLYITVDSKKLKVLYTGIMLNTFLRIYIYIFINRDLHVLLTLCVLLFTGRTIKSCDTAYNVCTYDVHIINNTPIIFSLYYLP